MGKVLIACEESQEVCKAFRERGHEAYSCDIQEPSGGHPEWHVLGDVLEILNPKNIEDVAQENRCMGIEFCTMDKQYHFVDRWDLLIAHPPCTYLTAASAVRLFAKDHAVKDWEREKKGWNARRFFLQILSCGVERIAIENPCPLSYFNLPEYSQIIEPYMFGDPWKKRTCLWLADLPILRPTNVVEPLGLWVGSTSGRNTGTGRIKSGYQLASHRDPKTRAKTFPGIAQAMADQWGGVL